jgi:osmotically-inducible protein OsmY
MNRIATSVLVVMAAATVVQAAPPQSEVAKQEEKLHALLVEKLGDDAKPIRVTITGNKAILTGQVDRRSTKELSEEVALYFPGIAKVDDQVVSRQDEKFGASKVKDESADADLEMTVKMKLRAEIGIHAEKIEVEACQGVVSLRGVAPEAARKEIALKTAAGVKGVLRVIDLLRVL